MPRSNGSTSRTPVLANGRKRKLLSNGRLGSKRKRSRASNPRPDTDTDKTMDALEEAALDGDRGIEAVEEMLSRVRRHTPDAPVNIEVVLSLCRVYTRLFAAGELSGPDINSMNETRRDEPSGMITACEEYHKLMELLLQIGNSSTQLTVLQRSMYMLKEELKYSSEHFWNSKVFSNFVNVITWPETGEAIQVEFAKEHLSKYQDLCFHFMRIVTLSIREAGSRYAMGGPRNAIGGFVTILSNIQVHAESGEESRLFMSRPRNYKITAMSLKRKAESAWLAVLSAKELDDDLRKRLLRQCTNTILPWMTRPEGLMDFLTDSYDLGGSMSLIALSGLFKVINEKNLDYPSFYPKLYSLLDTELLHSKHRSRFLRLLKQFLDSTHLPASLIASFIKRLARLSLFAPPAAIVALVPYIYNLLKEHPTCTFMIHRRPHPPYTRTNYDLGHDPFDMAQPDPQQTGAIDSSLWELETLQSHYHPNVASLAKILSEQFTKGAYNLEDFLDHGYGSMVDSELGKEAKKPPVVEWKIPKHFLTKPPDTEEQDEKELNLVQRLWDFT